MEENIAHEAYNHTRHMMKRTSNSDDNFKYETGRFGFPKAAQILAYLSIVA